VIYSGLWQPIDAVVRAAGDEDADFLGVSLLSGAHMTLAPQLMKALAEAGLTDVGVVLGGIIPESDVPRLLQLGVRHVFGPGAAMPEIVQCLRAGARSPVGTPAATGDTADAPSREVVERFRSHDRRALARLLTWSTWPQRVEAARGALAGNAAPCGSAAAVAVTGSAGVGKSTLIARLIELLRGRGQSVAVLACDPQSPVSGGALLGDRIRMSSRASDPGVFIRSVATAGGRQAMAENVELMIQLLGCFGFDVVLLETVGAGQGDTAVRDVADAVVALVQPETGDELQWEKAGVLEIADVVAVSKSDLKGAESVEAQLRDMLNLPGSRPTTVLRVSGGRNSGIEDLWSAVEGILPRRTSLPNGS
jgi:LAO/AO transport system ATPase